jgi:hypothetical protein
MLFWLTRRLLFQLADRLIAWIGRSNSRLDQFQ